MQSPSISMPTPLAVPKKKRRILRRWWFWVLLVVGVFVIVGGVFLWNAKNNGASSYEYLQESVKVERRDLSRVISTNGMLVADYSTTLSPAVSGTVTELSFAVGDIVKKNDVVLQFDADLPVASSNEQLKAPFDGRIIALNTAVGGIVNPGTAVVEIAYSTSHIEFFASEQEVLDLVSGQSATVTFPAYRSGRDVYKGVVNFVDVQKYSANLPSQTSDSGYRVKVVVEGLPNMLSTQLGLTADVEVTTAALSQALSLDNGAIQYEEDGSAFVYELPTVDDAFIAKVTTTDDITMLLTKQAIVIGFEGDQYSEVISGLIEGEEVLLYIPQRAGLDDMF